MLFIPYPGILKPVRTPGGVRRAPAQKKRFVPSTLLYLLLFSLLSPRAAVALSEQISLARPLVLKWRYETQEILDISPAVQDAAITVPLSNGNLVSLNLPDGHMLWRAELGGEITASPVADETGVYVANSPATTDSGASQPSSQGILRAIGAQSGVTLWSTKLPSLFIGSLSGTNTAIIGRSKDGRIYSIRKDNGRILWIRRGEQPFTTGPVVSADRLFAGSTDGSLFAIDQDTGRVLWRYRTGAAISAPPSVTDQAVYFASGNNYVYALTAREGRMIWRRRVAARVQSVVSTQQGVLVTALDNSVSLLSTGTGRRVWKQQMGGRVTAPPLADADAALFAPLSGDECVVLDLKTGKRLNAVYVGEDNNTSAAPLIGGGTLFLVTRQGLLALSDSD